ncbi:hypothetical protein S83_031804 [Arachis hypogaea]
MQVDLASALFFLVVLSLTLSEGNASVSSNEVKPFSKCLNEVEKIISYAPESKGDGNINGNYLDSLLEDFRTRVNISCSNGDICPKTAMFSLLCLVSDCSIFFFVSNRYVAEGDPAGHEWVPALCDVSIRPGWFWHLSELPKSVINLLEIYYKSVGQNCHLLLNVPPNSSGLILGDLHGSSYHLEQHI